jgi:hypothetical protein
MILEVLRGNTTRRWPLLERLTRDEKLMWVRELRGMVALLWMVSLLLICSLFAAAVILLFVLLSGYLFPIPSYVAFLVLIVVVTISTVRATRQDIQSEGYTLLSLTTIPDKEIIWSYVFAGIHRVRTLLGIIIGLAPLLSFFLTILPIALDFRANFDFTPSSESGSNSTLLWIVLGALFWSFCMALSTLGLTITAATLSVGLMLWFRNDLISTILTLVFTLPIASFILLVVSFNVAQAVLDNTPVPIFSFLILSFSIAILPYLGASAVARFSARKPAA